MSEIEKKIESSKDSKGGHYSIGRLIIDNVDRGPGKLDLGGGDEEGP